MFKPGTRVQLAYPDDTDLMQGLTQGTQGTVVERLPGVHHRAQLYDSLVLVRFESISDNQVFVMTKTQLKEVMSHDSTT